MHEHNTIDPSKRESVRPALHDLLAEFGDHTFGATTFQWVHRFIIHLADPAT